MSVTDDTTLYNNLTNLNEIFSYWKPKTENNIYYGYTIKYGVGKKCNPYQDFSIPNTELSPVYDKYVQNRNKSNLPTDNILTLLGKLKSERSKCQDQMSRLSNWFNKPKQLKGGRKTRRHKKSKISRKSRIRKYRKTRK